MRRQKKGVLGTASKYISRSRAIKKLQVSLADFRRLCILKGIYPREPENRNKLTKNKRDFKTFYWVKDIQFLAHEPLINKFREYKIFARRLSRAMAKSQDAVATNLEENRPVFELDHIIKERYPSFVDALRDIDDALCMVFLFANMPSDKASSQLTSECARLASEFMHFVIRTNALRKTFLSIKGIYYQAELYGQPVTWVVPYQFTQNPPSQIDFRVMRTFLELHVTMLGFINFKLFHDEGLHYPPVVDVERDNLAAGLSSYMLQTREEHAAFTKLQQTDAASAALTEADLATATERAKSLSEVLAGLTDAPVVEAMPVEDAPVDSATGAAPGAEGDAVIDSELLDVFPENEAAAEDNHGDKMFTDSNASSYSQLFAKCVFFLSREVPREALEFVIRACGGTVGWSDATFGAISEDSDSITHHIVDRPTQGHVYLDREYIQPQWVFDSINAARLLETKPYAPGESLPAHLSPFHEVLPGGYDPVAEHQQLEDAVKAFREDELAAEALEEASERRRNVKRDLDRSAAEAEEDEAEEDEAESDAEEAEDDGLESEDDSEESRHQRELAAESAGVSFSDFVVQEEERKARLAAKRSKKIRESAKSAQSIVSAIADEARRQAARKRTQADIEAEELRQLSMSVMDKRPRNLLRVIQRTRARREAEADQLRDRKKAILANKIVVQANAGKKAAAATSAEESSKRTKTK
ncbi:hypothetical protein H696_04530 [Fonticula alba]|uniref:Pescadillo homolog n=1 Tax=Fonticula alba TaxID=691883 RepID=A0A058Z4A5_FONAL|nr:hypothetical protein H696_04530 [Fonticula alba]KCV69114.1 hypothetical protein H696_04530 [Fonticula alba]|eukprot:XP_009496685.1 hypothetical protein H696_04530 [Fonticula alba]